MTPEGAIYSFFNGFGIPAYASSSVPSDVNLPYITYDLVVGSWYEGESPMVANIWYYGGSESAPNAKAREISRALGEGGKIIICDGGAIWIKRGSPWSQSLSDDDDSVKRRYLNFTVEFITPY